MKKVIMILIDSLMPKDLENVIKRGKAPALRFLMENGVYNSECATAFPTMTASADATLMTGVYPDKHKIPGLIWYHSEEKRIVNYINGIRTVLKLGIKKTAEDVLLNLNNRHLSQEYKTIFEEIEDSGKTAASINFIIYRGRADHLLKPPFMVNLLTKFALQKKKVRGPKHLSIGAVCQPKFRGRKLPWGPNQTCFKAYGVNDDYAIDLSKTLIASGDQPDFMAIYLPDHDHYLHRHIHYPYKSLEKIDVKIGQFLDSFGSWQQALQQNTFIILGDHGQVEIGNQSENNINLDNLLRKHQVVKIGKEVTETDEVIFANNERMVYVYPLKKDRERAIINTLLTDERIAFIAWKSGDSVVVENYRKKRLEFSKGGSFTDPYGESWSLEGDAELLDIKVDDQKKLSFFLYPDALSRLFGALFAHESFVIAATSNPYYEFISESFPTHIGGASHGSLHRTDSTIPLLVVGAEKSPNNVKRIVDLKDYILQLLNINPSNP